LTDTRFEDERPVGSDQDAAPGVPTSGIEGDGSAVTPIEGTLCPDQVERRQTIGRGANPEPFPGKDSLD